MEKSNKNKMLAQLLEETSIIRNLIDDGDFTKKDTICKTKPCLHSFKWALTDFGECVDIDGKANVFERLCKTRNNEIIRLKRKIFHLQTIVNKMESILVHKII